MSFPVGKIIIMDKLEKENSLYKKLISQYEKAIKLCVYDKTHKEELLREAYRESRGIISIGIDYDKYKI